MTARRRKEAKVSPAVAEVFLNRLFQHEPVRLLGECDCCGIMSSSVFRLDGKCTRCFNRPRIDGSRTEPSNHRPTPERRFTPLHDVF